ncbi:hypothetical protein RB195_001036 [Necator americanus]|uniref:Reverse transcriptase domain-containing protein n=1 Tax=Necator americanus TaxID=51031 RepID=A0ABR1DE11_NECAM
MMYGSETWAAPSTVMERLDCTERKLLRRLLGYFWPRVCHNKDLYAEIYVVYRRPVDRLVQRVLRSSSGSSWKKPPGRKRKFWTEAVKEDLRTLGVDRQFRYRICRTLPYILALLAICTMYSLTVVIPGWIFADSAQIAFCNPPLGKSNACQELRKVIRRLKVIMIVFVLSWFFCILGVDVGYAMQFTPVTLSVWQSNMLESVDQCSHSNVLESGENNMKLGRIGRRLRSKHQGGSSGWDRGILCSVVLHTNILRLHLAFTRLSSSVHRAVVPYDLPGGEKHSLCPSRLRQLQDEDDCSPEPEGSSHCIEKGNEKVRLTAYTISHLIEISREYKVPLRLTSIDLKKAFDTVETEAAMEALENQGVPTPYIKKGLRQTDTISPKIFGATLENAMQGLEWNNMGVETSSISQAELMLPEFDETCKKIGLQLDLDKKMLLRKGWVSDAPFTLNGTNISECFSYVYLETWTFRKQEENVISVIERGTEMVMLGVSCFTQVEERIRSALLRHRLKIIDAATYAKESKMRYFASQCCTELLQQLQNSRQLILMATLEVVKYTVATEIFVFNVTKEAVFPAKLYDHRHDLDVLTAPEHLAESILFLELGFVQRPRYAREDDLSQCSASRQASSGELVNATFLLTVDTVMRKKCYYLIVPYIFAISQQAIMTLVIAVDLLLALLFPVWYRICRTLPYILALLAICTMYSLTVVIPGWIFADSAQIAFCNPPLGKSNACLELRKVIRRLKVIMIVFVLSWFVSILGVDVGYVMHFTPATLSVWQSNMVFFALLCYTQTFYVCIWRSQEYRAAFIEQLYLMSCRKPKPSVEATVFNSHASKVFKSPSNDPK